MAARFGAPFFFVWSPPAMTGPAAGWLKKCLLDLFFKGMTGKWRVSTAQRICSSCTRNPYPFGEVW